MTDLETALNSIDEELIGLLSPLIETGDITELVFGVKSRNTPTPPFIRIAYLKDAKCDNTTIGSIGNREEWNQPIHIGSTVKEIDSPEQGFRDARALISKARTQILNNRQLNIPEIVRKIDSDTIQTVPYPFGKKMNLYGAGTILNINFVINNKI